MAENTRSDSTGPAGAGDSGAAAAAEIDASCRWPVGYLFTASAGWLFVASVFGLLASLKFHAPSLLADCPWMSYGRIQPLHWNLLVYGFGIQGGLALILWILARLARAPLVEPGLALTAAVFWNVGVAAGAVGIWAGDTTSFHLLEMPRYASMILFASYCVLAVLGMLTLRRRGEGGLYPSVWFLMAALFWFPWIFATAQLLLVCFPVRGAMQSVVNWWYVGNLTYVWFGCVGLGAILYFVPKLAGRPLHSRHSAAFTFWLMLLFGSLAGVPVAAPVPAWISSLSSVAMILYMVGVLAALLNLRETLQGEGPVPGGGRAAMMVLLGLRILGLAALLAAVLGSHDLGLFLGLTWFGMGVSRLFILGFAGLLIFGGMYYILPRIAGRPFPSPLLERVHVGAALGGLALQTLPLLLAGVLQAAELSNSYNQFIDAHMRTLMALRLTTLGELAMLIAGLALVTNAKLLYWNCMKECCPCFGGVKQGAAPAGVKP